MVVPIIGWSESSSGAQRGRVLQLYGRRAVEERVVQSTCTCRHHWLGCGMNL
nr:hypothetical protein [Providencia rettgeri]